MPWPAVSYSNGVKSHPKRADLRYCQFLEALNALSSIVDDMEDDPLTPEEVRVALAKRVDVLRKVNLENRQLASLASPTKGKATPSRASLKPMKK